MFSFALKRFALKRFALKCKHHIGLTPLYWHVVGRRTETMPREVFYDRSVCRSEGSRKAKGIFGRQTADGRKFLLLFRTACCKAHSVVFFTVTPFFASKFHMVNSVTCMNVGTSLEKAIKIV